MKLLPTCLKEVNPGEQAEAAQLLARAMAGNPLHLAMFRNTGPAAIRKQQAMFAQVLRLPHQNMYGVFRHGQLLGFMNYNEPGHCQLGPGQLLQMVLTLSWTMGRSLLPVLRWRYHWKRHDPAVPHLHFGPLAVDPDYQGQGIGSELLGFFCREADRRKLPAYLETDKRENLPLYRRFGFAVIAEERVLGVPNWFMLRETEDNG